MKRLNKKWTGLASAVTVSVIAILSCQSPPGTTPTLPAQVVGLQTGFGQINLRISLPYPKSYTALEQFHDFRAQMLEERRINKLKITITNVLTDFKAEKVVPLTQGGLNVKLEVPLGKNYIINVQGMDDLNTVTGAQVKGVFSVVSAVTIPDVDVNPLSTAIAEIIEKIKASDKEMAAKVDTDKLKALIIEGKSATSPFLVNFQSFADAVIAEKGEIPLIVPSDPVQKPGRIQGAIKGLSPGDAAVVYSNDGLSQPFIIVAPPLVGTATSQELEYRIDNVIPGDWQVRVVASGYQVIGDTEDDEVGPLKKATVAAGAEASADFEVKKLGWNTTPINASGTIGSSDQPDATMDGGDNIHLVWRQDGFSDNENSGAIFYSRWNGKTWSTDRRFISPAGSENFKGARNPAIAVGIDRTPHVVWSSDNDTAAQTGRRILFSRYDGVNWTKPLIISTSLSSDNIKADYPDIALNLINGHLFAVWEQVNGISKEIMISEFDGKNWIDPIRVSDPAVASRKPKIAVGTDKKIHVVWEVENERKIQYISWDGAKFSAIESVPFNQLGNISDNGNLDIQTDLLNRGHLIWRKGSTIQYILRSHNSWSQPELVHNLGGDTLPVLTNASEFLDNIGNVNVLWTSSLQNGTPVLRYRRRTNDGWELPAKATSATPTPLPTAFPTPTPDPSATPATVPSPSPTPFLFPGFEDLPVTENKVPSTHPIILIDSKGGLNAVWSNSGSNGIDSDIFHTRKSQPASTTP